MPNVETLEQRQGGQSRLTGGLDADWELGAWKERCSLCQELIIQNDGRIWRCRASKAGRNMMFAYTAAVNENKCGKSGRLFKS